MPTEHRTSATPAAPLSVVVDLNRCQAYAQCCFLAPDVFRLHGTEALWYDPAPAVTRRDEVRRAAAACPVQAIVIAATATAHPPRAEATHV